MTTITIKVESPEEAARLVAVATAASHGCAEEAGHEAPQGKIGFARRSRMEDLPDPDGANTGSLSHDE